MKRPSPDERRRLRAATLPIVEVRVVQSDEDDQDVRARVVRALADVLSGRVG